MGKFNFEEERVKRELKRLKAKRVLIQLPEGLKPYGLRLARELEKTGVTVIISAQPCYGACDLAVHEAKSLEADLILHYGHSKMLEHVEFPIIYLEARATVEINAVAEEALPLLKQRTRIGVVTTVQHVQALETVKKILVEAGKTVSVGDVGRLPYPGQVTGCDYSNAESIAEDVEAFLFVGGGRFHAVGVALATSKPTVVADPYEKRAFTIEDEAKRILMKRWGSLEEAKRGNTFAVLVGTKIGQERMKKALAIKKELEKKGKQCLLLTANNILPEALDNFPNVDVYINTACPRLSLENGSRFRKPMLTTREASVLLGRLSWEELCREGLFES